MAYHLQVDVPRGREAKFLDAVERSHKVSAGSDRRPATV
jgi:hypothetical protein